MKVNVAEYGAVHDGVTDDTAAIQRAIDAVYAAGGGQVWFDSGESYAIATGPIEVKGLFTTLNGDHVTFVFPDAGEKS